MPPAFRLLLSRIWRKYCKAQKVYCLIDAGVGCLKQDKLLLPLYVMLAQQRRYIAVSTDSPHLKLIAELYDKCQETLFLVGLSALHHSLCLS